MYRDTKGAQCAQCALKVHKVHKVHGVHGVHAKSGSLYPAWMEQAVPNLTTPRIYQSPGGAGARWAGPQELIFGYQSFEKIGVCTCLATAKEWARIIPVQTSQNVVQSPFYENGTG